MMFKEGEWIYHEFELSQIVKCGVNGEIEEVADGTCNISSTDMRDGCFPLTMRIKVISDTFKSYSNKIFDLGPQASLNHPDIHRYLVMNWVNCCQNLDDKELIYETYKKCAAFVNDIHVKVVNNKDEQIQGVQIFK